MTTIQASLQLIRQRVGAWDDITTHPHRFGGTEFLMGQVEIGHFHQHGMIDIPFTRKLRQALVEGHYTDPHHLLPESGWSSFYLAHNGTAEDAIQLFRLSYLHKRKQRMSVDWRAELATLPFSDAVKVAGFGETDA